MPPRRTAPKPAPAAPLKSRHDTLMTLRDFPPRIYVCYAQGSTDPNFFFNPDEALDFRLKNPSSSYLTYHLEIPTP
jgi:hypothetical protein